MGRRKIEIKKLMDSSSRQVTFSKRKFGLFKKANDLSTLCSADIAIVAFSPGGKPFSFGTPSVESVVRRFQNQHSEPKDGSAPQLVESDKEARVNKLNQQLRELHKKLEFEKKRGEMLRKRGEMLCQMSAKNKLKWDAQIDDLSLFELEEMKESLDELLKNVKAQISENEATTSLMLLGKNPVEEFDAFVAKKV